MSATADIFYMPIFLLTGLLRRYAPRNDNSVFVIASEREAIQLIKTCPL